MKKKKIKKWPLVVVFLLICVVFGSLYLFKGYFEKNKEENTPDILEKNEVSDKTYSVTFTLGGNVLINSNLWYDTSFIDVRDYNNGWECTHLSLGGLPALNLSSKELRKLQFDYLIDLRECGVNGARFDALKHLAYENGYFKEMRESA